LVYPRSRRGARTPTIWFGEHQSVSGRFHSACIRVVLR
jgi:hypothetical protein